jgi:hypothetical protein
MIKTFINTPFLALLAILMRLEMWLIASDGINGGTRHAMRLINSKICKRKSFLG